MEYTLTRLPKAEIEIAVSLPFSEFEPQVKRAAVLISESVEIEGFRKGKAPYDIVKQKVGEQAIYEEAAERAVRKTYPEAIRHLTEDGKLDGAHPLIGKPEITITKLAPGNELIYKVKLALLPQVLVPDYKTIAQKIRTQKEYPAVSDEETDKAVQWLREARTQLVTVARPAQKGDRVEVDFEIRHNGVTIEGGESRNHPMILGEGRFLPGFEDALVGLEAGQKNEFTIATPEDWRDSPSGGQLAGKTLDFSATMQLVQERKIPELTDEFAKGLGDFASAEALKQNVRDGLLAEKKEKETQRIRALMMQEIAADARMEVPDALIAGETKKMLEELKSNIGQMGMGWTDYLTHIKKTEDDLKKEWPNEAEKRVRIALCLREMARQEHIEPSEEEITARANQLLAQYQSSDDAAKNIDPVRSKSPMATAVPTESGRTSNGIDPEQLKEYAQGILKNEKVFELLEKM